MIQLLFLLHRYFGIAVGFILLLWCLSGFVMIYVQYPEMDREESLRTLDSLNLQGCCALPEVSWLGQINLDRVMIEMLDRDTPVLRVNVPGHPPLTWNLQSGVELQRIDAQSAEKIAYGVAGNTGLELGNDSPEIVTSDQWTVIGAYNVHRPLYRFNSGDDDRTQLYLSSRTGEVVLTTTDAERFWNYLGAVVHWLYPTVLRQHPTLWANVVIWLAVAGIFLTLTGLCIGVRQFTHRQPHRASPYTGVVLWHHYTGLVSGVITLLWVGSGLLSMNPWGALEGESASSETRNLQSGTVTWVDTVDLVARLPDLSFLTETVRLELYRSAGTLFIATTSRNGAQRRFDATTFLSAPLTEDELQTLASVMLPGVSLQNAALIDTGDAYYYEHHADREFPVFRIIADDDERRYYYLSATTGQLLAKVDGGAKWYRWLFNGVHRADFLPLLRERPLWDVLMLIMLAGVTLLCGTGTYLGLRRVKS